MNTMPELEKLREEVITRVYHYCCIGIGRAYYEMDSRDRVEARGDLYIECTRVEINKMMQPLYVGNNKMKIWKGEALNRHLYGMYADTQWKTYTRDV